MFWAKSGRETKEKTNLANLSKLCIGGQCMGAKFTKHCLALIALYCLTG
jgi:hypothetical protein